MDTDALDDEIRALAPVLGKAISEMGATYDASKITVIEGDRNAKAAWVHEANERLAAIRKERGDRSPGNPLGGSGDHIGHRVSEKSVLGSDQKMADLFPSQHRELSLARYLKGIATGSWDGADAERKAMAEGSLAGGGYMVPSPLSARVIDRARAAATVFRAGALTVPMTSSTLRIARVAGDPTAQWLAENAASTASDVELEGVDFTSRTLRALVKMSVELFEDAPNADAVVMDTISKALALELDRVVLRGSGVAPEPKGIRNTSGIDVISMGTNGGALTGYDDFSQAVENIQAANHEPTAVIYAPRTSGTIDRLTNTEGQPLQPFPSFAALRKFVTTQVPTDLEHGTAENASEAYVGDFSQVLVGLRTNLTLEVTRVAADSSSSAFTNLQVWVRAYLRGDVQLAHADAFSVITGIIPAA